MRRALSGLATLLLLGTAAASLAGRLGDLHWRLDLASHFRPYYALAFALAAAALAAQRRRLAAGLAGLLLAAELAAIAPLWLAGPAPAGPPALRVVHFNVLSSNPRKDDAVTWLSGQGADLVVVQEVDDAWAAALARAPGLVPLDVAARADNFGMALLAGQGAKDRVLRTWREELVEGIPALAAEVDAGGRRLAVLAVHTLPPVSAGYAARRDEALAAVAGWVAAQRAEGRTPVIVGDLNATPFSAPLRRLLAATGLVDSLRGFGVQASWPVGRPLPLLAIDHCLHDAALAATSRALGPDLGSDHLPLAVDLAWSEGQAPWDSPAARPRRGPPRPTARSTGTSPAPGCTPRRPAAGRCSAGSSCTPPSCRTTGWRTRPWTAARAPRSTPRARRPWPCNWPSRCRACTCPSRRCRPRCRRSCRPAARRGSRRGASRRS